MADPRIEITQIATTRMLVPIKGTAPLIVHNFSERKYSHLKEFAAMVAEVFQGGAA